MLSCCLLLSCCDNFWLPSKLEDSEKARLLLEESNRGASHPNIAELEVKLKKKETELKRIKAAEKARVSLSVNDIVPKELEHKIIVLRSSYSLRFAC